MSQMWFQPFLSGSTAPSFRLSRPVLVCCAPSQHSRITVFPERSNVHLGVPVKGPLASGTRQLLTLCGFPLGQIDPHKNAVLFPEPSNLEVWFWQQKDIIKKLLSGELDLGIVGFDQFSEYGQGNADLVLVHDDLGYADCPLSLAIPNYGMFENINSLKELAQMPQWTAEKPLRVATGFTYLGAKFMKEKGLKYVTFSTADGALEAAPAKGISDAILGLVGFNTLLEENNLKEIEGGIVMESQAVLVASRQSLMQRKGALNKTIDFLQILEGRLRGVIQYMVTGNMRGSSLEQVEQVAKRIQSLPAFSGLQEPEIKTVFCERDGKVAIDYFAIAICVPQMALVKAVRHLEAVGCSEVRASKLDFFVDEETPRWCKFIGRVGL